MWEVLFCKKDNTSFIIFKLKVLKLNLVGVCYTSDVADTLSGNDAKRVIKDSVSCVMYTWQLGLVLLIS